MNHLDPSPPPTWSDRAAGVLAIAAYLLIAAGRRLLRRVRPV